MRHFVYLIVAVLLIMATTPSDARRPRAAGVTDAEARWEAWERHQTLESESLFQGLEWRSIGPTVQGGRVVDVESVADEPYTFYVAYASGGLWKTTNNGVTFEPLTDDQPSMVIGDFAIDPNDPQRLWLGTGENNSSRSSYSGMGMFFSADGGQNWQPAGLAGADRIGRVLVDPRDGDRVLVAVHGRLYTEGGPRGVYLTTDAGETWERVLDAPNRTTGFIDLVMHPENPDVMYAAGWDHIRRPWEFVEGGPGSGIWKSTDGGTSWSRLAGFPGGDHVGRIGLAIAASSPDTIYASMDNQSQLPREEWEMGDFAISSNRLRDMTREEFLKQDPEVIETFIRNSDLDTSLSAGLLIDMVRDNEVSMDDLRDELADANANLFNTNIRGVEVYRSDDGGASWRLTHDEPIREVVYSYGYYFGQIRVAPDDPDEVYVVGVPLIKSNDGGATWRNINPPSVHVDHHEVWIDPNNAQRVISGNDGGLDVSYDGGKSWLKMDAQPVGQFYTVYVDMADPYNVYGGTQDNGTLKGPSTCDWTEGTCFERIGGGDGMYVAVDPRDSTTYVGFQFGYYFRSGPDGRSMIRPRDALGEPALRYNWSTPVILSPHSSDIVYFGSNRLYRSTDRGDSWTPISGDLTTSENRGDVPFGTITSVSESPDRFGLIWVGTDDGNVHVTDSGGTDWRDVGDGLPADRWVTRVEASRHDADRAYVTLNGYRDDDMSAYVYRTDSLGRRWRDISGGLPAEPVNVIREDPVNQDVLYVGTDRGVYVSLDRGDSWMALQAGLPNVPVHDLVVHPRERELVAGTHGRSFWIVDVLPVQDLDADMMDSAVHVFPLEDVQAERGWRSRPSRWFHREKDEPRLKVPFWSHADGDARLAVIDDNDHPVAELSMSVNRGVNRFTWNLLMDQALAEAAEAARLEAMEDYDPQADGARAHTPVAEALRLGWPLYVLPGEYSIRITTDAGEAETTLTVNAPEPREPRQKPELKIRGRK